ncbi:mucin-13 isoform X3 [Ambystoma mexicanum]|uniref:mucin-13 isoform X2 n=1 Tax=Ambystoma mexicanum TaxID=8296 RepID=UPI0037E8CC9D
MRGAIFCALLCVLVHSAISQESTTTATSTLGKTAESTTTATSTKGTTSESTTTATSTKGTQPESTTTATSTKGTTPESTTTATSSKGTTPESSNTATSSKGTPAESSNTATSSKGTPAGGNSSTAVPAPTTPGGNSSTPVPAPTTPGGDTSTAAPATTKPADSCATMPCGASAADCLDIHQGYICRCPYSYYYNETEKLCAQGKQFFGRFDLNTAYSDNLQNVTSKEYKTLYANVSAFFAECFKNRTDYAETIIAKISKRASSRSWTFSTDPVTVMEAINMFILSSNMDQTVLEAAIREALKNDETFSNFTKSDPCDAGYCDEETTTCKVAQNDTIPPTCECKHSFFRRPRQTTACTACAPNCTLAESKQCVQENPEKTSVPVCQCIAGYKHNKEKDNCEACSIGYSGKNCEDDFLLILIIVGSIGGALVLALLGGVIGLSLKANKYKKSPDRERLLQHEENPVFSGAAPTNDAHFPRVQVKPRVNANHAASNPYVADEAFQRSVPTRDYDDDNDSWYEMSQKQNKPGNNYK